MVELEVLVSILCLAFKFRTHSTGLIVSLCFTSPGRVMDYTYTYKRAYFLSYLSTQNLYRIINLPLHRWEDHSSTTTYPRFCIVDNGIQTLLYLILFFLLSAETEADQT